MADDDPFADLGETLEDDPDDEDAATDDESEASTTEESSTQEPVERWDPMTDNAFSYEEAKQRPFYARETTIEDFDSWLKYELERELNQQGYQNIVVREMTDALLRTVVEEDLVDEVAERFEQARESASFESGE
jgi:glycosidase